MRADTCWKTLYHISQNDYAKFLNVVIIAEGYYEKVFAVNIVNFSLTFDASTLYFTTRMPLEILYIVSSLSLLEKGKHMHTQVFLYVVGSFTRASLSFNFWLLNSSWVDIFSVSDMIYLCKHNFLPQDKETTNGHFYCT